MRENNFKAPRVSGCFNRQADLVIRYMLRPCADYLSRCPYAHTQRPACGACGRIGGIGVRGDGLAACRADCHPPGA